VLSRRHSRQWSATVERRTSCRVHSYRISRRLAASAVSVAVCDHISQTQALVFTSDKGGRKCKDRQTDKRTRVCLLARLLKNAYMDLDEMLRVDRCRDMDELINF